MNQKINFIFLALFNQATSYGTDDDHVRIIAAIFAIGFGVAAYFTKIKD